MAERLAAEKATEPSAQPSVGHPCLRRALWLVVAALLLAGLAAGFWLRKALYHRWVRFPREEKAWVSLRAQRIPVEEKAGWEEFKGIVHSHSHLSHDSEVPFEEILEVMKRAGIDFICMSDHPMEGAADFSVQWRGLRDGKLFIPGFEMRNGFMPFGVAPGIVLSNSTDPQVLARQVVENGGVLFYAHPEEPRDWNRPELAGMEVHNIHVDFKRNAGGLSGLLPDLLVNHRRYPDHVFRLFFSKQEDLLKRWDDLSRTRHITGVAGNDCHQNTGFRGFYTDAGTVRIEDTSPQTLIEHKLNLVTRPLARVLFGRLEPGRKLFHIQLDPYHRMGTFVNTHVLAGRLTEPEILEGLRAGRAFIGFDGLVDSTGFRWFVTLGSGPVGVMGETVGWREGLRLVTESPVRCRVKVLKEGAVVHESIGRRMEWVPLGPGKYRVEAEVQVLREWVPWVYANPIEVVGSAGD